MNKYLLVCDLDGTLLDASGQVDEVFGKNQSILHCWGHFL